MGEPPTEKSHLLISAKGLANSYNRRSLQGSYPELGRYMLIEGSRISPEGLLEILRAVVRQKTADFSGIGLVVCDSPEKLPLVPLSNTPEQRNANDLVRRLTDIASRRSAHHDGFHVLSSNGELTRVAQYFSPPIVADAQIDRSKRFGGRYLAALFGSAIPGVIASGIASEGFGIAVFRSATEAIFEDFR